MQANEPDVLYRVRADVPLPSRARIACHGNAALDEELIGYARLDDFENLSRAAARVPHGADKPSEPISFLLAMLVVSASNCMDSMRSMVTPGCARASLGRGPGCLHDLGEHVAVGELKARLAHGRPTFWLPG